MADTIRLSVPPHTPRPSPSPPDDRRRSPTHRSIRRSCSPPPMWAAPMSATEASATGATAIRRGSALEEAIGALEGGQALAFASGMAAAYAVLELIEPGSTVVVPDSCYLGVADAFEQRAARLGWTLRRVDIADTEGTAGGGRRCPAGLARVAEQPADGDRRPVPDRGRAIGRGPHGGGQHLRHPCAAAAAGARRRHRPALRDQDDLRALRRPDGGAGDRGSRHLRRTRQGAARHWRRPRTDGGLPGPPRAPDAAAPSWLRPRRARRYWRDDWPGIRPSGASAIPVSRTTRDTSAPGVRCPASAH